MTGDWILENLGNGSAGKNGNQATGQESDHGTRETRGTGRINGLSKAVIARLRADYICESHRGRSRQEA